MKEFLPPLLRRGYIIRLISLKPAQKFVKAAPNYLPRIILDLSVLHVHLISMDKFG